MVFTLPPVSIIYICIYIYIYKTRERRFQLIRRNVMSVTAVYLFGFGTIIFFFISPPPSRSSSSSSSLQATLIYHFAIRHCHSREITIPTYHECIPTYKRYVPRGIIGAAVGRPRTDRSTTNFQQWSLSSPSQHLLDLRLFFRILSDIPNMVVKNDIKSIIFLISVIH